MTISMITGLITKHVFTSNGFDIFSIKPLINDPENPIAVDAKYHTSTIKGNNLEHLEEGQIYTFGVSEIPATAKYPISYKPELIVKSYPNITEIQIEFMDNLLIEREFNDTDSKELWSKLKMIYLTLGKNGVEDFLANAKTHDSVETEVFQTDSDTNSDTSDQDESLKITEVTESEFDKLSGNLESLDLNESEDLTDTVQDDSSDELSTLDSYDLLASYKTALNVKSKTNSPVQKALASLTPFSPIVQYLMSNYNVTQADALALANSKTIELKNFKSQLNNIFKIYYNGDKMPIDAIMNVQQVVDPNPDLTPQNPYLLDSAIRYYIEQNLYATNNDYTTKETLVYQLNASFQNSVMYDWDTILENYSPQPKSKFKVCRINDILYFTLNKVYFSTRTIFSYFRSSIGVSLPDKHDLNNMKSRYNLDFEPSAEQKLFIEHALTSKTTLLTGKAGTGKSGTIAALTKILKSRNLKFELLAPTAKAAQQLTEYSGFKARTIHSWNASQKMTEPESVETKFLIMDEMSMTDEELCAQSLDLINKINKTRASSEFIHLIWSGDVAQLLPVGFGAPFRDALNLYPTMTIRLTKIYRQTNADLIDVLQEASTGDFQVTNISNPTGVTMVTSKVGYKRFTSADEIANILKLNIQEYSPERYQDFGVISPLVANVESLNCAIQRQLNPNAIATPTNPVVNRQKVLNGKFDTFALGDPIVLTQNTQYIDVKAIKKMAGIPDTASLTPQAVDKMISLSTIGSKLKIRESWTKKFVNGDTGYISQIISDSAFVVTLRTPDGPSEILITTKHITISNLDLAYAITVHKAQGSQYKHILFINTYSRASMSSRNLVYTAMSRAKEDLMIFSNCLFSNITEERLTLWPKLEEDLSA